MKIIYDDLFEFSEIVIRCNDTVRKGKCSYCPFFDRCKIDEPENRHIQCGELDSQPRKAVAIMDEYINREEMLKYIDEHTNQDEWLVNQYNADWIYNFVDSRPTADVVPKSEVDNLKVVLEMQEKAYESLKELYDMDTEALIKAREKTEVEVAREIFEEIEKVLKEYHKSYGLFGEFRTREVMEELAELKKKYTEGKS